jgi:deazaflavin-dependent oxidoreductase (nitroreductase family)
MPTSRVRAQTPWVVKHVVNPLLLLSGALPVLTVTGHRTGKRYRTPVNVLELDGTRYLVSPRGETGWSQNLRRGGEAWLRQRGREVRVRATEVPPAERPPLIAAYLARWGRQTGDQFAKLPDPADHPTFRLDEA